MGWRDGGTEGKRRAVDLAQPRITVARLGTLALGQLCDRQLLIIHTHTHIILQHTPICPPPHSHTHTHIDLFVNGLSEGC